MNCPPFFSLLALMTAIGCQSDKASTDTHSATTDSADSVVDGEYVNPDVNNDGNINIFILGTSTSINGGQGFSPDPIAQELQRILDGDPNRTGDVNVVFEDIHTSTAITIGLGGNGAEYTYTHHRHSLLQYYYWPADIELRMQNLKGEGDHDWDYVIIASDPYIISNTPGVYALGAHKIAAKVEEGGGLPLLLMMWSDGVSEDILEEFTYRTANGSAVDIQTVPAGLAWGNLSADLQDTSNSHPSPNGAYLAAASIYSHITRVGATESEYQYNADVANGAFQTMNEAEEQEHYSGELIFDSPFAPCDVTNAVLSYNHTGSSSENGILGGLNWVFDQATESLENGGGEPITFNYGRANTNFEAQKRYQVDPERFLFSFGFPMQDHGNHGKTCGGGMVTSTSDQAGARVWAQRRFRLRHHCQ